jgi:hypothetical protein
MVIFNPNEVLTVLSTMVYDKVHITYKIQIHQLSTVNEQRLIGVFLETVSTFFENSGSYSTRFHFLKNKTLAYTQRIGFINRDM